MLLPPPPPCCGRKPDEVGVVWALPVWSLLLLGALPGRDTDERPASREMRSARSASRLLVLGLEWCPRPCGGRLWPRWPSLMAVVERAEREVVVLVGVPLGFVSQKSSDVWC